MPKEQQEQQQEQQERPRSLAGLAERFMEKNAEKLGIKPASDMDIAKEEFAKAFPASRDDDEEEDDSDLPTLMRNNKLRSKGREDEQEDESVHPDDTKEEEEKEEARKKEEEEQEEEQSEEKKEEAEQSEDFINAEKGFRDREKFSSTNQFIQYLKKDYPATLRNVNTKLYHEKKALEQELAALKKSVTEDYVERDKYRKIKNEFEDRYFQESDAWKDEVEKPLEAADKEFTKWVHSGKFVKGTEEFDLASKNLSAVTQALSSGDEAEFYVAVDAIGDLLPKGTSARLAQSAAKLWDAVQFRNQAFKEKDKVKSAILEATNKKRTAHSEEAARTFDENLNNWEKTNAKVIERYNSSPESRKFFDYAGVKESMSEIKALMKTSIDTRTIHPKLISLINAGALESIKQREIEALVETLKVKDEIIARLEGNKDKNEKILKKVGPSRKAISSKGDESSVPRKGGSVLAGMFEKYNNG